MIGNAVAHYRVLEKLGEGGMGVVYKARDAHLDRFVAFKVLPAEKVGDPERKRRFVQEAKAASALSHPNIVTIYDIGEAGGVEFIAMEYVAGKTLDQLIGRKGLSLNEALKLALQIADALSQAHAAGIVHRDLKPSNVMVNEHGLVKVLDFGLAKLTEPLPGGESAPTETARATTEEGTILGTVAYMSPEQAEGKPVDARSDIFSFGSLLYEMLTGRRAFQGETKLSTLSAVLRDEPKPLREVADSTPRELERVVALCHRKDPGRRFQHMEDVKVQLEALKEDSDSGRLAAAPAPPRGRLWSAWYAVAAAIVVVCGAAALWWLTRDKPAAPQPVFTQLTIQPGQELFPSLSPDGKAFVYASDPSGNFDIYFQRVGGRTAINLTADSPADDTQPAFSPDGERIAFRSERSGGGIFVMGATGESVKRLTDFGYYPAWSPDGRQIVLATGDFVHPNERARLGSQLWVVDAAGGEKRQLTRPGAVPDAVQPNWSPHGYRIAYWSVIGGQRDIWTVSAGGADPRPVTRDAATDWSPIWSPDGAFLYFASDRGGVMNVWRVAIDERSGKVRSAPQPVTAPSSFSGMLSMARQGGRIAYVQQTITQNLQGVGFDPATEKVVGQPAWVTQGSRQVRGCDLSPDGEWLVFSEFGRRENIFVVRADGRDLRQLTDDPHRNRAPRWSPDGKRIAFGSNRSGAYEIWTIDPDGSGLRQLTYRGATAVNPVWSPDGARLAYWTGDSTDIMETARPWQNQSTASVPAGTAPGQGLVAWSWSPDGRSLAGSLTTAGGIAVFALASRKCDQLTDFGYDPVWLADSRRLLFWSGSRLYVVDTASRKPRELLSAAPNTVTRGLAISRDNRRIYFNRVVTEADVWLMTLE